jgi:hypothetical protein
VRFIDDAATCQRLLLAARPEPAAVFPGDGIGEAVGEIESRGEVSVYGVHGAQSAFAMSAVLERAKTPSTRFIFRFP